MRRIIVTLTSGRRLEVGYREPAGLLFEVVWYLTAGVPPLSDADARKIDAACLHDLIERRGAWRMALALLQERRQA